MSRRQVGKWEDVKDGAELSVTGRYGPMYMGREVARLYVNGQHVGSVTFHVNSYGAVAYGQRVAGGIGYESQAKTRVNKVVRERAK